MKRRRALSRLKYSPCNPRNMRVQAWARTAFVLSNAFPRSDKILSVAHLLHQLFRHSRAFGCWLRHEWFGPLVTADRGFTAGSARQSRSLLYRASELTKAASICYHATRSASFILSLTTCPPEDGATRLALCR